MDEEIRFIRVIVPATSNSEVLYVQSNREAQIGEFLALPKGGRLKVLDNTHDGSLVVKPAPRWGPLGKLIHMISKLLGRKPVEIPVGALLMVEENHRDPALRKYYEYVRQRRDRAERSPSAAE